MFYDGFLFLLYCMAQQNSYLFNNINIFVLIIWACPIWFTFIQWLATNDTNLLLNLFVPVVIL